MTYRKEAEMSHFFDAFSERMAAKRSQVVVGLDPQVEQFPQAVLSEAVAACGQTSAGAARAILQFNRAVIDAVTEHAAAVKCQIAFYEKWGLEGLRAYCETIAYARQKGLVVIGDVKRNDIGSTARAYASAHLGPGRDGRWEGSDDLVADAITVNAYLGYDGVAPFLERASESGRGVFALVKTSNPSSGDIQDRPSGGRLLYECIGELVEKWGEPYRGRLGYSVLGAVVGATYPETLRELRSAMPHTFFLVPGFGAQGAGVEDVLGAFDEKGGGAVVSASRSIIYAYDGEAASDRWQDAVRAAARRMQTSLWEATH